MESSARSSPRRLLTRRAALQAGVAGLGMAEWAALRQAEAAEAPAKAKSVIFIFLTGGISQQDSFDPEAGCSRGHSRRVQADRHAHAGHPDLRAPAAAGQAGRPATRSSARCATNSNGHEEACHMLLTGRLDLPPGFSLDNVPNPNEWPSIPARSRYASASGPAQSAPADRAAAAERQRSGQGPAGAVRRPAGPQLGRLASAHRLAVCPRQRRLPALLPLRGDAVRARLADDLRHAALTLPEGGEPGSLRRPDRLADEHRAPAARPGTRGREPRSTAIASRRSRC